MSTGLNRESRRAAARKDKRKKNGLVAVSLLASTGILSSYLSGLKPTAAQASTIPSWASTLDNCVPAETEELTIDASGNESDDDNAIDELNSDILDLVNDADDLFRCVTITFDTDVNSHLDFDSDNPIVIPSGNDITFFLLEGSTEVVLDGEDASRIIDTDQKTVVDGLEFVNGFTNGEGGAIVSDDELIILDSNFNNNNAEDGGGAVSSSDDVLVHNSVFEDNVAVGDFEVFEDQSGEDAGVYMTVDLVDGGAIYSGEDVVLSSTAMYSNYALGRGGAVFAFEDITVEDESVLNNNDAAQDGGALFAVDDVYVYDSRFAGNGAGDDFTYLWNREFDADFTTETRFGGSGGTIYSLDDTEVTDSRFEGSDAYDYFAVNSAVNETYGPESTGNHSGDGDGGVIYSNDDLDITNSRLEEGFAEGQGGALWAEEDVNISSGRFNDNEALGDGGALYFEEGYANIQGSRFNENESREGNGGAIFANDYEMYSGQSFSVSSTIFTENSATDWGNDGNRDGGAIYSELDVQVFSSTFTDNFGEDNAGAIYSQEDVFVSGYSSFVGNSSTYRGGAIYAEDTVDVNSASFTGNISENSDGGAIYSDDYVNLVGADLSNNSAGDEGGAIYSSVDATVSSSFLNGNISGEEGGAIYVEDNLTVQNGSTFSRNYSRNDEDGGAAFLENGDLEVYDSSFYDNQSGDDGGVFYVEDGSVLVERSGFYGNSADYNGGAIWSDEAVEISDSTFMSNSADEEAGGALWLSPYEDGVYLRDNTFANNSADDGGAVWIDSNDGTFIAGNNTFYANSAERGAGAMKIFSNDSDSFDGYSANYLLFNTFVDNYRGFAMANSAGGQVIGEIEGEDNIALIGNLFADSQSAENANFEIYLSDNAGWGGEDNLSTGEDLFNDPETIVTYEELELGQLDDNGGSTQTIALGRSSAAIDYASNIYVDEIRDLMIEAGATYTTATTIFDQRNVERVGRFDVGAFEYRATSSGSGGATGGGGSALVAPATSVVSINPTIVKGGDGVTVAGINLDKVTDVYVNGVKVDLTMVSGTSLKFNAPAGFTGLVNVRFMGPGFDITVSNGLDYGSAVVVGDKATGTIPGFAANSTKLTRPMKKAIRAFVAANPDLKTVTCKGFTSAPATAADMRLATARGQVTCDFIKKINPALSVKVLKGAHTNTPGSDIRRVRIVMK